MRQPMNQYYSLTHVANVVGIYCRAPKLETQIFLKAALKNLVNACSSWTTKLLTAMATAVILKLEQFL